MHTTKPQEKPDLRQLGITERPPEHLLLAALTFRSEDLATNQAALESLRALVRAELEDKLAPPESETGELGFQSNYEDYGLLITLAISTSGYERLGVPEERRPRDLQPMPPDILDSSGSATGAQSAGEGDLLLKVCSDDVFIVEHVLRRVEHELGTAFQMLWVQTGAQRYNTRQSGNPRHETRALIGFLDGTSNLDPSQPGDRALIFTDHTDTTYPPLPTSDQYSGATFPPDLRQPPTEAEPAVLDAGSYLAVEVFLNKTSEWDAQSRADQERSVGQDKQTGQRLPNAEPDSHVLKSNPGRPEDAQRRFLRRGYALVRPEGTALARGLVFMAFGRTLSTQVEFVQRAWINNPNFPQNGAGRDLLLERFVQPRLLSGGFYFAPPLQKASQPWSWVI
jgi:Dyp-type peroxidase family